MYGIWICVLCFVLGPEEGSHVIQVPALEKLMAVSVTVPAASFYILSMIRSVSFATFFATLNLIFYLKTFFCVCSLKMIESRNAVGQYDTTLQLKAQVPYYASLKGP